MKTLLTPLAFLALTLFAHADFPIGPEFLPSYVDRHESKLIVPAGETVTLSGTQDIDAIEVRGELSVPGELTLKYINITVAEGGKLTIGTAAAPNVAKVELIKKDVPLDTDFDPFQWGHGVTSFGTFTVHGRKLAQTWSLIQPVEKGGTTLVLDYLPADWQVGDKLLIPDTKQLGEYTFRVPNPVRHESPVTIQAISGNTITLSKPLDFEHHAITHQGQLVARPAVANCTRNIVFRSESLVTNRRGHIAVIHTGSCDFRYASILGMGRTTIDAINSTSLDLSHTGTNQIAKYAFHGHHVAHHSGGVNHGGVHVVGCYVDGLNSGSKWGIVDHTSPGFHAEENVITGHVGSGLVTEDGNEVECLFKRNFCHGATGNGRNGKQNMLVGVPVEVGIFAPGSEGAGIWNHSPNGRTLENYCINNSVGIQWMYLDHPGKEFVQRIPPVTNDKNVCVSNGVGVEEWDSPSGFRVDNQVCCNNGSGMVMGNAVPGHLVLNSPAFVNTKIVRPGEVVQKPYIGVGISASAAYTDSVTVNGGVITGFELGLMDAKSVICKSLDIRGNGRYDLYFQLSPHFLDLEGTLFDTRFDPPPKPNQAMIVSMSIPASVQAGSQFTASITVKNIGTKTWAQDGTTPYGLGSESPRDNTRWGTGRIRLPVASVAPNQEATFTGQFTAPTVVGDYAFAWAMVQDGVEWFFDGPIASQQISVTDSPTPPDPPDPPVEVWEPANVGPPFGGDATLRVRNGLIERKK